VLSVQALAKSYGDAGVLGAVLTGMVAAENGPDIGSLADEKVAIAEAVEPRHHRRQRAHDLHAVYVETYRALEPLFPRL
jgi:sugar (pentulose or hexulose) kinase